MVIHKFEYKTKPMNHQADEFETSKDLPARGIFLDMGLGKSKIIIDTAYYLYINKRITGLLVLAPNGVHHNWAAEEIPKHLVSGLLGKTKIHTWFSSKANTLYHQAQVDELLGYRGFSILLMSYDSIMTVKGKEAAKDFLKRKKCLFVLDESPKIKRYNKRTIRVMAYAKYAPYRRILTGTLVDDKPFDVYTQIKWLDFSAWKCMGIQTYDAFKSVFGIWEKRKTYDVKKGQERIYPAFIKYRNMKMLRSIIARYGCRVESADVPELDDLPPITYIKRFFEMTAEQKRVYKELKKENETIFGDGNVLSADLAIVKIMRYQQITSNYLPSDDDDDLKQISNKNPRLDELLSVISECGSAQVIVWSRYTHDIDLIMDALKKEEVTCVRYDGKCNDIQMAESIDKFKSGEAQVFIANTAKGCEGLTLTNATYMIYYNNYHKLAFRLQSTKRFHRYGQKEKTFVIDLVALGSSDEKIIDLLRSKKKLASYLQGDKLIEWI